MISWFSQNLGISRKCFLEMRSTIFAFFCEIFLLFVPSSLFLLKLLFLSVVQFIASVRRMLLLLIMLRLIICPCSMFKLCFVTFSFSLVLKVFVIFHVFRLLLYHVFRLFLCRVFRLFLCRVFRLLLCTCIGYCCVTCLGYC